MKKNDTYYIELPDGRLWCPSLQCRGTRYSYIEPSLKALKDYTIKTLDFIAIDFETSTKKQQYPCQIGIAVVRDGIIEECISRYIQPPQNIYDETCISVHHITPEMTKDEPEFPEVWEDIKQYFENSVIVAHNAQFDIAVFEKTLDYYQIKYPSILGYTCTCQLFNRLSLEKACKLYDIELSNHHDGASDAKASAQLYINWVKDIEPLHTISVTPKNKPVKIEEKPLFDEESMKGHSPIKGDLLKKDLSQAIPDNPFYDKKIVITGVFSRDRREIALQIKQMGGDINTTISKNTNYVIIGKDPGPVKIEKTDNLIRDGYNIKKLYEDDIDIIFKEYQALKG